MRFVYSRGKRTGERDCDVVGNTQRYGRPGYLLAEGKGANIRDAKGQFDAVAVELKNRMEGRGPIFNAIVATTSLRYIQWHAKRNQWIAYLDDVEQPMITDRLAENVARSARELDRNRVYLLDGEADDNQLPRWAMTVSATPFRVFQQMRTDTFHPLLVGEGQILVYYGAS